MPPANLILQALHGIRADLKGVHDELTGVHAEMKGVHEAQAATNARLDGVVQRLDGLSERVDVLAQRTTAGFVETNTKLAALTHVVEQHDRRLDYLLTTGLGAEVRQLGKRVTRLESARRVSAPRKKR